MGRPVGFERSTTVSEVAVVLHSRRQSKEVDDPQRRNCDSAGTVVAPLWQNADAIFRAYFFLFGQNIEQA